MFPFIVSGVKLNLPFYSNFDLAIHGVQRVKPALHQQRPLDAKCCDEEVEAHSAEAVALQEGHEEAEAHKDHHMHVLEACGQVKQPAVISTLSYRE